ncbi:hypothetical protein CEXT_426101 [Caerostris extrusa]|uniref:Uncharacterized protein n=1 Tax=Caerostris extrusa TaxID=172846 RepID=A0AAV4QV12_CAEEX|nr:hypothetical protein CEXT_426101 [Caerostris extrusa]
MLLPVDWISILLRPIQHFGPSDINEHERLALIRRLNAAAEPGAEYWSQWLTLGGCHEQASPKGPDARQVWRPKKNLAESECKKWIGFSKVFFKIARHL